MSEQQILVHLWHDHSSYIKNLDLKKVIGAKRSQDLDFNGSSMYPSASASFSTNLIHHTYVGNPWLLREGEGDQ